MKLLVSIQNFRIQVFRWRNSESKIQICIKLHICVHEIQCLIFSLAYWIALDVQCKICVLKSYTIEDSGRQCPCMGEPVSLYECVCVEKGVFQLIQQMQSNLSDDACEVTDIFSLPCQMHTNAVHPTGRTSAPCSLSRLSFFLRSFCTHYLRAPFSLSGDRCVFLAPSGCSFAPMTVN